MKMSLILLTLASSVGLSWGYTITVTNQSTFGDPALPLVDNTCRPLDRGTVSVGYFDSDDAIYSNLLDFAALLSVFHEYGTSTSIAGKGATTGLLDLVNPDNWTTSVPPTSTGGQIGQNIYVVFGEGDSLANSDSLAIFKSNAVFGKEDKDGNGGAAVDLALGKGDLLFGFDSGPINITAGQNTIRYSNGIKLQTHWNDCVPEPSTNVLTVLSGLVLVIRRRR